MSQQSNGWVQKAVVSILIAGALAYVSTLQIQLNDLKAAQIVGNEEDKVVANALGRIEANQLYILRELESLKQEARN